MILRWMEASFDGTNLATTTFGGLRRNMMARQGLAVVHRSPWMGRLERVVRPPHLAVPVRMVTRGL